MKKFLIASGISLLALGSAAATPAGASSVTTESLVAMCKNKSNVAEQNFCHGYGQGVYDLYLANRHPKKNPPFVCIPNPGPTRQVVIDSFVDWAANNAQYAKASAADTLMRYLAGTYPCKK
jgi:hypothetical protein